VLNALITAELTSQNTCHFVCPSRSCFTHITEQGGCRRQLTRFCTSQLLPKVSAALHFRNQHSALPYICSRVHAETAVQCNASPSTYAYWSPAYDPRYVTQSNDGSIAVESVHGNAKLVLAASTASVTVSWGAEVPCEGKACLSYDPINMCLIKYDTCCINLKCMPMLYRVGR
jgi:Domain of unknown function (DUF4524)